MPRPVMTYALAHAAGWDAGNRSMRAAGRTVWSVDDYNAAAAEFERLYPLHVHMQEEYACDHASCVP